MQKLVLFLLGIFIGIVISGIAWGAEVNASLQETTVVVKPGDTLSKIAHQLLGDEQRWKEIAKLNAWLYKRSDKKSGLAGANYLLPGDKLVIAKKIVDKEEYRIIAKHRILKKMFEVRGLEFITKERARNYITSFAFDLMDVTSYRGGYFTLAKDIENIVLKNVHALELHALANAIMKVTEDDDYIDAPYILAAIAWQESHYRNRRGKAGEVSCFQLKPSTINKVASYLNLKQFTYNNKYVNKKLVAIVEENPSFAANVAHKYLKILYAKYQDWEKVIERYNGKRKYAVEKQYVVKIMDKFNLLKNGR